MDPILYMDIYVVRHGLTAWNVEKKYLGWTNQSLIQSEKHQLDLLKNYVKDIEFDACFSSDLIRCVETFSYLCPNRQPILDTRLRELNFGEWEGKTYETLKENHHYQQWLKDWETIAPPKGESLVEFKVRINAFLKELLTTHHQKILIVTHGGVIRYMLSLLIKDLSFWDVPIKNNKGYVLHTVRNDKGEWTCFSYSEVPCVGNENM